MKRMMIITMVLALASLGFTAMAEDSDEPSTDSVLQTARDRYQHDRDASAAADTQSADQGGASKASSQDSSLDSEDSPLVLKEQKQGEDTAYTPIVLSFVPGLSVPEGIYDTRIALGAVGTLNRNVKGTSLAGIFSLDKNIKGVQMAGIFSISSEKMAGIQASGIFNIAKDVPLGIQAAGVFNISQTVRGVQSAGLFNTAQDVQGLQLAGLFNGAKTVRGIQASGFLNTADSVKGIQAGIVNVADTVKGAQFGLVNFSKDGLDSLSVIYEPATGFGYAYWQGGFPWLYLSLGYGANVNLSPSLWYDNSLASCSLGTQAKLWFMRLNFDAGAEAPIDSFRPLQYVHRNAQVDTFQCSPFPSLRLSASLPLAPYVRVVGGLKTDIAIPQEGINVPSYLAVGNPWSGTILGQSFSVWPKFFLGIQL